jgi:glycosyltransferase involved in cell wall biosynthesis
MDSVSIVIPCYNPTRYLREAVASARAQAGVRVEVVLVNDGSTSAESLEELRLAAEGADRYVEQLNRGLPAARNAGFRAASHSLIIPLDSDDLLRPEYAAACVEGLRRESAAAFAFTDYEVFGTTHHPERLGDYNLYRLLRANTQTYAALIRREDWEGVGGYDESMTHGYEDWEFWIRLGAHGRFGYHVPHTLFRYRKHGPSRPIPLRTACRVHKPSTRR